MKEETQNFYIEKSSGQLPTKQIFRDARGLAPYEKQSSYQTESWLDEIKIINQNNFRFVPVIIIRVITSVQDVEYTEKSIRQKVLTSSDTLVEELVEVENRIISRVLRI